jgi:hypothetical protein
MGASTHGAVHFEFANIVGTSVLPMTEVSGAAQLQVIGGSSSGGAQDVSLLRVTSLFASVIWTGHQWAKSDTATFTRPFFDFATARGAFIANRALLPLTTGAGVAVVSTRTDTEFRCALNNLGGWSATLPFQTTAYRADGSGPLSLQLEGGDVVVGNLNAPVVGNQASAFLAIRGATSSGRFETSTGAADGDGVNLGLWQFADRTPTRAEKRRACIGGVLSGTTANQRGA